MGWWGHGILEGDTPLDIQPEFWTICGLDYDEELDLSSASGETLMTGGLLDTAYNEILDAIEKKELWCLEEDGEYKRLFLQIWGLMIMQNGAHLPDVARDMIIEAAENDEWANESSERKAVMDDLIGKLSGYKRIPTEISQKGLFQAIGEHLSAGKKGLVNK
jgi:hypothetical protein